MRRDIICIPCAKEKRKRYPTDEPFPGEHLKFVFGKAKQDMLCDSCGTPTPIKKGEDCCAFSVWTSYGGHPYYEWENEFITVTKEETSNKVN